MSRTGILLCYPFEEKRLLKWVPPFIVQPKLDGVRCRAINEPEGFVLLSSEAKEIVSVPHINLALDAIPAAPPELDGELYVHGLPFEEIFSRTSRTTNIHLDYRDIQFHIFDLVSGEPQVLRTVSLLDLEEYLKPPLHRVEHVLCNTLDDIMRAFDHFIEQGYEGIIVRHYGAPYVRKRSNLVMKFKPKKDDYYKIAGWSEEMDKDKHSKFPPRLGRIICMSTPDRPILGYWPPAKKIPDGYFGVGSGPTEEQRFSIWDARFDIAGKLLHVKYQHITSGKGVPRFPVFVEVVDVEPEEVKVGL